MCRNDIPEPLLWVVVSTCEGKHFFDFSPVARSKLDAASVHDVDNSIDVIALQTIVKLNESKQKKVCCFEEYKVMIARKRANFGSIGAWPLK